MKFKLFLLASLLVYSCNNSDNEFISLYSFLPEDSSVIVNINNLNNTKEILDNNELLRSVLSSTHEISAQLNLLSKKNQIRMEFFLYLVLVKMRLPSHILESLIHLIQFKKMIY